MATSANENSEECKQWGFPVGTLSSNTKEELQALYTSLQCPVCHEFPTGPIFSCVNNRHMICEKCLPASKKCPVCSTPVSENRSVSVERCIVNFLTPCKYKFEGCPFMLRGKDVKEHVQNCLYRPFLCIMPKCQEQVPFKEFFSHLKSVHKDKINGVEDSSKHVIEWWIDGDIYATARWPPFYFTCFNNVFLYMSLSTIHGMWEFVWIMASEEEAMRFRFEAKMENIEKVLSIQFKGPVHPIRKPIKDIISSGQVFVTNSKEIRNPYIFQKGKTNKSFWRSEVQICQISPPLPTSTPYLVTNDLNKSEVLKNDIPNQGHQTGDQLSNQVNEGQLPNLQEKGRQFPNNTTDPQFPNQVINGKLQNDTPGQLPNKPTGRPIPNEVTDRQLPFASTDRQLPNESNIRQPPNESGGGQPPNESNGKKKPKKSNDRQLPIESNGRQLPNEETDGQLPNEATGRQLPFASTGRQLPNEATDRQISNESNGRQPPNEETDRQLPNEATGVQPSNESNDRQLPNESKGKQKPKKSNGRQPPSESNDQQPPNESSGGQPPNESSSGQPPNESFGRQLPNESNGKQKPKKSKDKQPPNESSGGQLPNESNGEQPPNESFGRQLPNESNGKQKPKKSKDQQPPNELNVRQPPNASNGRQLPNESNGRQLPNEYNGQQLPNEYNGKQQSKKSTGRQTQNDFNPKPPDETNRPQAPELRLTKVNHAPVDSEYSLRLDGDGTKSQNLLPDNPEPQTNELSTSSAQTQTIVPKASSK